MASSSVLLTIAFLALANTAAGLKCYVCDSSKGVTCNYGLLSFSYNSQVCEVNSGSGFLDTLASIIPSNCVKLVGKDKEGNEYTARGCAPSTGPVNTCNAIAKFIQFVDDKEVTSLDCYTCDSDNCNSATKVMGMTSVGFLVACFLFLF